MKKREEGRRGAVSVPERFGFLTAFILLCLCAGLCACTVESNVGDELEKLAKGQQAMLERIEKIDKSQQELLTAV